MLFYNESITVICKTQNPLVSKGPIKTRDLILYDWLYINLILFFLKWNNIKIYVSKNLTGTKVSVYTRFKYGFGVIKVLLTDIIVKKNFRFIG